MPSKTAFIVSFASMLIVVSLAPGLLPRVERDASSSVLPTGTDVAPMSSSWRGFPDADPDSGKFLGAAGNGLSTLAGQTNALYLGIPAGRSDFVLGIFDGDGIDNWDQLIDTADQLDFELYKDPLKSGSTTLFDSWDNTGMMNDQWTNRSYSTDAGAKSPSGNYFYRLEVNWHDPAAANDINSFKVRVDGQISVVKSQAFCVEGAPISGIDPPLGSGDPNPGETNDPGANSYDGDWQFYSYVPTQTDTITIKDGDLDRADDTDDPNTPNTDPDGPGPALEEGVNVGAPADDPDPPSSYTIAPSIKYTVTEPSGGAFLNSNPSGNQEWEDFVISVDSSINPDHLVPGLLSPGLWNIHAVGVDAHNLACLAVPNEMFAVDESPLPIYPPPVVEPDRSATVIVPPPSTESFAHNITNLGASQIFDLSAVSAHGWTTRIYNDTNRNGILDPGEPRVNNTGVLPANSTYKIIVQVDVPVLPSGTVDVTTVMASSELEWAVQGTAEDTITLIANRAPVADAGGPYTGSENSAVTFDGSGSSDPDGDPLQYRWDFENDGAWDTAWSSSPIVTHVWGDDCGGTVALQVTDGVLFDTDTATFTIRNILPSGSLAITSAQHEGSTIQFSAHVTDPGSDDLFFTWSWGDGTPDSTSTYYNNGVGPDPYPSCDIHPRDVTDTKSHTYGDNGAFTVRVLVRDDDSGGTGTPLTITATPDNLPPSVSVTGGMTIDEGQSASLTATATDPGSDDLKFSWSWGDGTSDSRTYYNNGVGPDPPNSPGGTYPFTANDDATHAYGDNGIFSVSLTVADDDGGSTNWAGQVTVNNLPPTIRPFGPYTVDEGSQVASSASALDPGSDDLTFFWVYELGPTIANVYYNDGSNPDPPMSPGGTYPFFASDSAYHIYGDNGVFTITLTVTDDDGGSASYSTTVTVANVAPRITQIRAFVVADISLRIAGEKWHDVILRLFQDGTEVGYAQVVRYPGSPDDQMATLYGVEMDLTKSFAAVAYYTPDDDPINGQPNGADPAWLILRWQNGAETWLHHTFNVMHPETYVWTVDNIYIYAVGQDVYLEGTASDPGSDDLTFVWDSGDGRTATETFYNDGIGPDPFPSPDVNPAVETSKVTFAYPVGGTYTITLTVTDDDGGSTAGSVTITIG